MCAPHLRLVYGYEDLLPPEDMLVEPKPQRLSHSEDRRPRQHFGQNRSFPKRRSGRARRIRTSHDHRGGQEWH